MDALLIIHEKLCSTGMKGEEADALMGRFLEEEAESYVECMKLIKEYLEK